MDYMSAKRMEVTSVMPLGEVLFGSITIEHDVEQR
jgi:hypothetical protein